MALFPGRREVVISLIESLRDALAADGWAYGENASKWKPADAELGEIAKMIEILQKSGTGQTDPASMERMFKKAISLARNLD